MNAPTAPTLPNPATRTNGSLAPNPTPTRAPTALARLSTAHLQAALAEARRDADVLALGLRSGLATFRAAGVVCELRQLRTKIGALSAEIERRGEATE